MVHLNGGRHVAVILFDLVWRGRLIGVRSDVCKDGKRREWRDGFLIVFVIVLQGRCGAEVGSVECHHGRRVERVRSGVC